MVGFSRLRSLAAVATALMVVACGEAPGDSGNGLPDVATDSSSGLFDGLIGDDTTVGTDTTITGDATTGADGAVLTDAAGDAGTTADASAEDSVAADAASADAAGTDTTSADTTGTDATGADTTGADTTGADTTGADTTATDATASGDATADAADASACPGGTACACEKNEDCDSKDCRPPAGGGAKVCQPPCQKTTPPDEICDGLDNDCDGNVDDKGCDDANLCTKDACELGTDGKYACATSADKENENCDDGSACSTNDACSNGKCVGTAVDCDDQNVCTDDSCDPKSGCVNGNNTASCDDGDVCTEGDACADAKCAGGKAKVCDDGNACTKDSCDKDKGCVTANDDAGACDDSDPCTDKDACKDGACQAGSQKACDDKDPCTVDLCDSKTGKCASEKAKDGGSCDDTNPCTDSDACAAGLCAGVSKTCDDSDACTKDSCDPKTGCVNTGATGGDCDDNNPCTTGDKCDASGCAGQLKGCDDSNECTSDSCDPKAGCVNTAQDGTCDDGDVCTATDACKDGACAGTGGKDCDDNNPCTADGCDASTGDCSHTAQSGKCDDGSKCTSDDACDGGKCTGKVSDCDDNKACTTDSCDKDSGCVNTNNTDACDDGNACTSKDVCEDGACVGAPLKPDACDDKNACTKDSCNSKTGCVNANDDTATCDDGDVCTTKDTCKGGSCQAGSNTCQCKTSEDCKDDGNLCNGSLICTNNKCVTDPKSVVTCDASKDTSCQTNTCDKANGKCALASANDGEACTEGSLCTLDNQCAKGVCLDGEKPKCDDDNTCTADACDAKTGDCAFKAIAGCTACKDASVCDDKNACTKDACIGGKCSNAAISGCSLLADLTAGAPSVDKTLYLAGGAISVSYAVGNIGLTGSAARIDRVYLSQNNTLGTGDLLIGSAKLGSVGSQKIQPVVLKGMIPAAAATGTWYVIVVVDATNLVKEAKETNNSSFVTTKVQGLADLKITTYKPDTTASFQGGKITFTLAIENGGSVTTPVTKGQFYISTDTQIDAKDLKPYTWDIGALAAGKSWTGSRFVLLPKTLPNGTYYIGLRVDDDLKVLEGDEANNVAWVKIAVGPAADLEAVAFSASSNMTAASSYLVGITEKNTGDKDAGAFVDAVYLSTNTGLGSTDIKLLDINRGGLAKGAQISMKAAIKIPAETKTGTYYLIFLSDRANAIAEKNEFNNQRYVKVAIAGRSDLVPYATTLNAKGWVPGGTGAVSYSERNIGTGKSGTYYTRFYLSTDGVYDSGDVTLATSAARAALSPSQTSVTSSATFTIPTTTKPGTYYILHRADATGVNTEVSETNNVKALQVTVLAKPDITVSGAKLSSTAPLAGTAISVNYTVTNKGGADTGTFYNGFYLSTSATSIVGPLLSVATVTSLAGGKSAQLSRTITLPASTKAGIYYLFVRGDYNGKVAESDEGNNLVAAKLTVQAAKLADLQVVGIKLSSTKVAFRPGDSLAMVITVKNAGVLASGTFSVGRYLSTNTLISTGDPLLGSTTRSSLAPGASSTFTLYSVVPATQKAGTFYAGAYVDNTYAINEIVESNNGSTGLKIAVLATPDLSVVSFAPTKTFYKPGEAVSFTATYSNIGNAASGIFNAAVRLSTNTIISTSDTLMKTAVRASLGASTTSVYTSAFVLPSNTVAGIYYLGLRLDDASKITEITENNNIAYVKITVQNTVTKKADLIPYVTKPTKTEYVAGQAISWTGYERNIGNITATSHVFRVYLSRSSTSLSSAVFLKSTTVSSLAANGVANMASTVTLPTGLAGGTWYVHFLADYASNVSEILETNNLVAVKISVTALADLRTLIMTTDKAFYAPGATVKVNWSEYNLGGANAGAYTTGAYLSTDSVISGADKLLATTVRSGLLAGKSAAVSTSFVIPANTAAGVYYLGMWADNGGKIAESSDSNNYKTVTITVTSTATKADLFVQSLTSTTSSYKAGQTFSVTGVGQNIGKASAGAFRVGYYLSKDAVITTGDTFLASKDVTSLTANGSVSLAATLKLPIGTTTGIWYIGAYLDDQFKVAEGVETNNYLTKTVYVTGVADLSAVSISMSEAYKPGAQMYVSVSEKNLGGATAGAHTIGVYLSTNNFISTVSDKLLYNFPVTSLAAGATYSKGAYVTLPAGTAPGDYYLGIYTDNGAKVPEISESNQTAYKQFTVQSTSTKPDLTSYLFKVQKTAYKVGDTLSWSGYERNVGGATAGSHTTRIYLCKTTTYTTTSGYCFQMQTFAKSPLAVNAITSVAGSWKVPTSVGHGTWYVVFSADHNKNVAESIETNNTRYETVAITGLADLEANYLYVNTKSFKPGTTISATYRERNIGGLTATNYTTRFYLSTNTALSTADILLKSIARPALAAGAYSATSTVSLLIPTTVKPGTYYLGYYTNYPSVVSETTSTNNIKTIGVVVLSSTTKPDLSTTDFKATGTSYYGGSTVYVTGLVKNLGGVSAGAFRVGYYLSTNSAITTGDKLLRSINISSVTAGGQASISTSFQLPTNLVTGTYYVGVILDDLAQVSELSELNNTRYSAVKVTGRPDLNMEFSRTTSGTYTSGASVLIQFRERNIGGATAGAHDVSCYLSTNSTISAADTYLGKVAISSLGANVTSLKTLSTKMPTKGSGVYYIGCVADIANKISEVTTSNNSASNKVTVPYASSLPDLITQSTYVTAGSMTPGGSVSVSGSVRNIGKGNAGAFKIGYYIHNSLYLPSALKPIATLSRTGLNAGLSASLSQTLKVPTTVGAGTWYVHIKVDYENKVAEASEGNNDWNQQVLVLP